MFTELRTNLRKPLLERSGSKAKAALALEIGVSPQKLEAILQDRWRHITRDSLERVADYLGLGVVEVFQFVRSHFWEGIEAKGCTFLRGLNEGPGNSRSEFRIRIWDETAINTVRSFLHDAFGELDTPYADQMKTEEDVMRRAKTETCIVVGSPKSNEVTEIILSRFFEAEPFQSKEDNRRKIPFGFCWGDQSTVTQRSSLTCSELAYGQARGKAGIVTAGGHVAADFRSAAEFPAWETTAGRDCGIVFVANQPFGTGMPVKLIALAGFSGVGTVAAAKALVRDFRDLEPLPSEKCVYGIVEARYSKRRHPKDGRTYKEYYWRFREGGREPIEFKSKENPPD